ncbi:hypothetical protein [Rhodococcus sp. SJ-2]
MTGSDDRSENTPLNADERRELEVLRAEVAKLRGESTVAPAETVSRPHRHTLRWAGVVILLVLVFLLAISSVVARYARSQILDTDRYVTTVTPLASDPEIQAAITNRVTDEIFAQVDVQGLTEEALTALTEDRPRLEPVVGLAPVIAGQAESFVHDTVGSLVASDQFETLWVQTNRAAHDRLAAVLTGDTQADAISIDDSGTVSLNLAPIIDKAKSLLVDRGFAFADQIPEIDKQFVLFQSPELIKAQRAVNALDRASGILPWLTLLAVAGAIWTAPRGSRLRTLAITGVTFVVAMLVLALAIMIGRSLYLDNLPAEIRSPGAAAVLFDALATPLRSTLRAVLVAGLVVAVGAYLIGGSASAMAVRRGFAYGMDKLRRPDSTRTPSTVEVWLARARVPLRAGIVAVAVLVVVFWNYPTGAVVGWTVFIALLALLLLEIVVRPLSQAGRPQV